MPMTRLINSNIPAVQDMTPTAAAAAFTRRLGYFPAFLQARTAGLNAIRPALNMRRSPDDQLSGLLDRLDIAGQMTGRNVVNQSQYIMNKTGLANYILVCPGDRVEMSHPVEGRLPFLDHKLVEHTRALPVDQKIKGAVKNTFIVKP